MNRRINQKCQIKGEGSKKQRAKVEKYAHIDVWNLCYTKGKEEGV